MRVFFSAGYASCRRAALRTHLFKERGEKLYRYDICVAERGREAYITAAAEACNLKSRIVIFVIEDERQIPLLKISGEYRFAVKRNGKYHFYGGN